MEEYMEENSMEQEEPETETGADITESFTDTVSGNDAVSEEPPLSEENGQGELLERLDALVEALSPGEEEPEEPGTETEALPSETETAVLELLEKIYEETAASQTADNLYYEAWTESQIKAQERQEKADTYFSYTIAVLIGITFMCACITGLLVAKVIWGRFK